MKVNFVTSDFKRSVANAADLILFNRYYEENPSLTDDGASLLSRPGMALFTEVGNGPIRGMASEAGSFDGDLFVASDNQLYRVKGDGTSSLIYTGLANSPNGVVNFAITANIEDVPAYCFIADGGTFLVYIEDSYATNVFQGTAAAAGNQVRIDNTYYQFTAGSVDTGTPAGTAGNPWLVALGASFGDSVRNLANAINVTGIPGTDYSMATTAHPSVQMINLFPQAFRIRSRLVGAIGNSIVTTETGANIEWANGGTLVGGGSEAVLPVSTPDDVGIVDVAVIDSFVVCIPAQGQNINGRFYWIEPGEITIDPLNFATAESAPDGINGVTVYGDQFWLSGDTTTEVWFFTGDPNTPVRRLQGVLFDRGTWADTAVAMEEGVIVTDAEGGVFLINGGEPTRLSTPAIEEQIRTAIQYQQFVPP